MASKENRPDPYDVYQLLKSCSDDWDAVSRELKVPDTFSSGLEKKGTMYSDDTKLDKVIRKWLQSWCSPPTWDNLIEALERLQWKPVAEEVTQFLTTDPKAIKKYNWKPSSAVPPVPNPSEMKITSIPAVDETVLKEFSSRIDACVQQYNTNKPQGIIFIVGMYGADGTDVDVDKVQSTFKHININFAVLTTQSPTSAQLTALVAAASKYEYPLRYKFIAFYFSGHGGTDKDGNPFVQTLLEGRVFIEQNIIEPLKSIERIRLFFFDCCLSQPTTTAGARSVDNARSDDTSSSAAPIKKRICPQGEVVAYAVSKGQKAYGNPKEGGEWTRRLCDNILKPDPIVIVLLNTNGEVQKGQQPLTSFNVDNTVIICKAGVEPDAKVRRKIPEENISNQPSSITSEESFITAVDGRKLSALSGSSDLVAVLETIHDVVNWQYLGSKLGLEQTQLDIIAQNYKGNVEDCRREMISQWLNTGDASWRALVRALASKLVEKRDLAMKIADEHCCS